MEGWGLYPEWLADEMGLYSSDLDRLGMLASLAFRAARLVVDTGLHALGWTNGVSRMSGLQDRTFGLRACTGGLPPGFPGGAADRGRPICGGVH